MLTSSWNSPRGVPVVLAAVVDARWRMLRADLLLERLGAWKRVMGSRVFACFSRGGRRLVGLGWGWGAIGDGDGRGMGVRSGRPFWMRLDWVGLNWVYVGRR